MDELINVPKTLMDKLYTKIILYIKSDKNMTTKTL